MQRIGSSIPKRRNNKPSSTSSGSLPTKLKSNKPPQHTIAYKNNNDATTKQDKADAIKRSYKKQSSTFSFNRGRMNSNGSKVSGKSSGTSSSRGPMKQISNNLRSSSKSKSKSSKVKKEATSTSKARDGISKAKAIDPPAHTDENGDAVYQKSYQNKTKSMDNKAEVGWVNVPKDCKVSFKTKPNSTENSLDISIYEASEDDEEEDTVQINILHSQGGNKYKDKLLINPDQVKTSKEICFSDNTDNPFPDEVNFDETFTTVNTEEDVNGIQVVVSKEEVVTKKENQVMYTMDGGNESTKLMSKRQQRKVQAKQQKNANTRAMKASLAKDTSTSKASRSKKKKKLTSEEIRKERVQQNLIKLQTIAGQEVKKKQELLQKESKLVMNVVADSMDRRDSPFDRLCSSTPHEISRAVQEEFKKQKERPFDGICFQPSSQETFDDGYSQISMDDEFTYGTNAQQSINSNSLFGLGSLMDNNNNEEEEDDLVTNNRSAFDSSRLGCFESGILWILNGRGCTFGRNE